MTLKLAPLGQNINKQFIDAADNDVLFSFPDVIVASLVAWPTLNIDTLPLKQFISKIASVTLLEPEDMLKKNIFPKEESSVLPVRFFKYIALLLSPPKVLAKLFNYVNSFTSL